ncbi:MAG: DUF616 domain-containing protein [Chitinivibrionales bacterium]|nr:DUF616 domain-containing protein [Chitinivibrionales bacterium]
MPLSAAQTAPSCTAAGGAPVRPGTARTFWNAPDHIVPGKNKNIIFTFIFGDYDSLKDPLVVTPGWDYYCISDRGIGSDIWKPVNVANKLRHIACPKRKASLLKIEHFKYIPPEYDICITLDGSMVLNTDLNDFIEENRESDPDLMIARHPDRTCIYDEAAVVLQAQLDTKENVVTHMQRYALQGFPRNQGLYGTRMMVKNNRSAGLRRMCEIWGREYRRGSRRDQLSMNYAIWKAKKEGIELTVKEFDFRELYFKSGKFMITRHKKILRWR